MGNAFAPCLIFFQPCAFVFFMCMVPTVVLAVVSSLKCCYLLMSSTCLTMLIAFARTSTSTGHCLLAVSQYPIFTFFCQCIKCSKKPASGHGSSLCSQIKFCMLIEFFVGTNIFEAVSERRIFQFLSDINVNLINTASTSSNMQYITVFTWLASDDLSRYLATCVAVHCSLPLPVQCCGSSWVSLIAGRYYAPLYSGLTIPGISLSSPLIPCGGLVWCSLCRCAGAVVPWP